MKTSRSARKLFWAAFLQRKVDAARLSIADGKGRTNDAVEAKFAARRARITDPA